MTTNAGAFLMEQGAIGFGDQQRSSDGKEIIDKMFPPEFRNRLDSWILFHGLTREVILRVVDKELKLLEAQLAERQVTLEVTPAAREWLAEHGYDPSFGARPMGRLVEERIKRKLAEALLFGELLDGGTARVDRASEGLAIGFDAPQP